MGSAISTPVPMKYQGPPDSVEDLHDIVNINIVQNQPFTSSHSESTLSKDLVSPYVECYLLTEQLK